MSDFGGKVEATFHPYTPPPIINGDFEGEVVGQWVWRNQLWEPVQVK